MPSNLAARPPALLAAELLHDGPAEKIGRLPVLRSTVCEIVLSGT